MKQQGLGATIRQVDVFESTRPNPVASVDEKIVTDGPVWYGQIDKATGLVVLPAPFSFEISSISGEPKNESISENVLSQEQNANGLSVNQGSGEPVERVESVGSSDGGNSHDASDQSGSGDDSSSATVKQVITSDACISALPLLDDQGEPVIEQI